MGTKNNEKPNDCYRKAEPDEPMFVLLARDKHAPQLVEMWAGMRATAGEDPAKVEEALKCAKAMRKYRYDRRGAPLCEMCGSDSRCTKIATKIVTEDDTLWQFWCANEEMQFLVDDGCKRTIRTIDEYFATDEVDNEYCKDEALRVFHETRAMRARANEAVMGADPELAQPIVDEMVRLIKRDCPFWAPEVRVFNLLPYLQTYGDPLYAALKALSDDERKGCGVDEIIIRKTVEPTKDEEEPPDSRDLDSREDEEELPDYGGGTSDG